VVVGPGEDRVVVEPGEARQADTAPVRHQLLHDPGRRDGLGARPRADEPAVERDGVEDIHVRAVLDGQALDGVDAVQLGPAGGHLGQVPAGRRGRAADPPRAVESSVQYMHHESRKRRKSLDLLLLQRYRVGRYAIVTL
jgi:hypothetical protein